jgi:hypothetical protein
LPPSGLACFPARGLRRTLPDVYVPRYGPEWEAFLDSGPVYARIDADRMFTFHMSPDTGSPPDAG